MLLSTSPLACCQCTLSFCWYMNQLLKATKTIKKLNGEKGQVYVLESWWGKVETGKQVSSRGQVMGRGFYRAGREWLRVSRVSGTSLKVSGGQVVKGSGGVELWLEGGTEKQNVTLYVSTACILYRDSKLWNRLFRLWHIWSCQHSRFPGWQNKPKHHHKSIGKQ